MDPAEDVEHPAVPPLEPRSTPDPDRGRRLRERLHEARLAGRFENPCETARNNLGRRRRLVDRAIASPFDRMVTQLVNYAKRLDELFEAIVDTIDRFEWAAPAEGGELQRRVSSLERRLAAIEPATGHPGSGEPAGRFAPWYSPQRFEDAFRGTTEQLSERYLELASRFAGHDPVLDIGCGRGELVRLFLDSGIETRGIDIDAAVIADAVREGLPVEQGDGVSHLGLLPDASLGGLLAVQVVEHLTPQQLVDLVALAADKLRGGGLVFADTPNPQSLFVFTSALYLDPTHTTPIHPAYLAFLFREAGFADVRIEHRSPVPEAVKLPSVSGDDATLVAGINDLVRQLNDLLYGPQDYAVVATR